MKLKALLTSLLLAIILVFSCKSPTNYEGGSPALANLRTKEAVAMENADLEAPEPAPAGTNIPAGNNAPAITRKIIKDGRMEIRVKELEQGKTEIDSLVKKYNAYYADETFNSQDFAHGYNLKIRIPAAGFEVFIAEIEAGIGELAFKNITSRDVTEEFIDLETRLKNKRNYLTRYNELLKQARTVKDILEIEEKTRLIEEEVESVEGRLKYLSNQVDFSTLDLQISKKNDYNAYSNNKGSFIDRLKMSVVKGWFGLVSFTLFVIRIWPFWIIMAGLYYIVRLFLRRRKKQQ